MTMLPIEVSGRWISVGLDAARPVQTSASLAGVSTVFRAGDCAVATPTIVIDTNKRTTTLDRFRMATPGARCADNRPL